MYVVDTDVSIDYMKGKPEIVNLLNSIEPDELHITTISVGELFFGAHNSSKVDEMLSVLKNYIQQLNYLPFNLWDSVLFEKIKSKLKKKGTPIGDADTMNAAIAMSYDFKLITRNVKHYQRIKGLKILSV
jgi:tRNA(fMet)-specific endonuclease VapC